MVYTFICKKCGQSYRAKTRRSMFCSEECRREADKERKRLQYGATRGEKVCPECGQTFVMKSAASNFCSKLCSLRFAEKKKRNREKMKAETEHEISLKYVFQREKGICYLCGGKCDFSDILVSEGKLIPGNTFPVVDFIAKEQSGATVKLAHFYCKKEKENGKL